MTDEVLSAQDWLQAVATAHWHGAAADPISQVGVELATGWQRLLYEAGFAGIDWPTDVGGQGQSHSDALAFAVEEAKRVPYERKDALTVGLNIVAPAILEYGSTTQREFLRLILRGEQLWCQLFSEPDAGSDLASIRVRAAEQTDGSFVVDGQKIWTSKAQIAHRGLLIARTGKPERSHRGLSCFLIDMTTPGITVRPIKQMSGSSTFCEVFFDQVHIPLDTLLGPRDDGWRVVMATLAAERRFLSVRGLTATGFDVLLAEVRKSDLDTRLHRDRLAAIYTRELALHAFVSRLQAEIQAGRDPGALASAGKLLASRLKSDVNDLAIDLLGSDGMLLPTEIADGHSWQKAYLTSVGSRIGGGTENMHLNSVAERHLYLPRG